MPGSAWVFCWILSRRSLPKASQTNLYGELLEILCQEPIQNMGSQTSILSQRRGFAPLKMHQKFREKKGIFPFYPVVNHHFFRKKHKKPCFSQKKKQKQQKKPVFYGQVPLMPWHDPVLDCLETDRLGISWHESVGCAMISHGNFLLVDTLNPS